MSALTDMHGSCYQTSMTTPSSLLTRHLERKGWGRPQLLSALERAGHRISRQRVSGWFNEGLVPDGSVVGPLCDALDLSAEDAAALYAACGVVLPKALQP
jgi:hypothetical protein